MGQPTVFRLCSGRPHRSLGSCQYGVKQEEKRHCENMVSLELHREDSLYYTESECGTILRAPAGSPPLRPQKCASPLVSALEAESPQKIESHCSNSVLFVYSSVAQNDSFSNTMDAVTYVVVVILPTGGPAGDKGQVPGEVSEVSL